MARKKKIKTNHADVTAFLNKITNTAASQVRATSDRVAREVAKAVYEKSQEYVPKDTGNLASTGKIVKDATGKYTVIYTADYAFFVHENMRTDEPYSTGPRYIGSAKYGATGNAKNYTTEGTGPKYLERAVDEVASNDKVIKYIRDALGRFRSKTTLGYD